MMDATDESPPNARPPWTKVPIAQLSPNLDQLEDKCIDATVTLVWPYSSSTKSLALLLAEPDFRLRRSNGQVKAVFHGRVAEKVAGSLVGIGYNIRLALSGLEFVDNNSAAQTPGRSIAWDVHFKNHVSLEVESSKNQSLVVVHEKSPEAYETEPLPPSTPRTISFNPDNTSVPNGPGAWGSPAFLRSARSSYGETLDSAYDPFTEEDGFVHGRGRKRPRYSLRRGEWRVVDEPESPREREEIVDWDKALDEDMDLDHDTEFVNDIELDAEGSKQTTGQDPVIGTSEGFIKPSLELAGGLFGSRTLSSNDTSVGGLLGNTVPTPAEYLPTDTPQLRPIPSPGLPIPSPILANQTSSQGYFSPLHVVPQASEAQSLSVDVNIDATNQGPSFDLAVPMGLDIHDPMTVDLMEEEPELDIPRDVESRDRVSSASSPDRSEPKPGSDEEESEIESNAEDAGVYYESQNAPYEYEDEIFSQDEEDYDDDEEEEEEQDSGEDDEDEYSQAEGLPPQPQPQPQTAHEVIVLDSDSEDELTSDQPAPPPPSRPMHPGQRPHLSFPAEHTLSSLANLDNEEEWSAAEDEAPYERVESAGSDVDDDANPNEEERSHDTDLDDESSVDILARDHFAYQLSKSESSPGPQQDHYGVKEAFPFSREKVEAYSEAETENQTERAFETPERSQSVIDLDSSADEAEADVEEDVEEDVEADVERSPNNLDTPNDGSNIYQFDEVDDRHTPPPSSLAEPSPQIVNHKRLGSPETRIGEIQRHSETKTQMNDEEPEPLANTIGQQLLTPDPTQETMAVPEFIAAPDTTSNLPDTTQTLPSGLNISLPSALDSSFASAQSTEGEIASVVNPGLEKDSIEDNHEITEPPKVLITAPRIPDRHALGLRSKLSYFAPLATLIDHYNALVDTISIVHEISPIAKATSGSKDFFITIQLTDPSMAGTTLQAQIFRRRKAVIPSIIPGNAILLRDFKVRTYDHSIMLVSVESSSWAVFNGTGADAQIRGPPVEYGSEERAYENDLRSWYNDIGIDMLADSELQAAIGRDEIDREPSPGSPVLSDAGSIDSGSRENSVMSSRGSGSRRSRKSHRRVTIHELRDGTRYTEVGSPSTRESIHELRDGTVYATR